MSHEHEPVEEITQLYRCVAPRLFVRALVLTRRNRPLAEDLVQEVFHDAIKKWETLGTLTSVQQERWLFRVLINKTVDHWRAARWIDALAEEDFPHGPSDAVDGQALCHELMERVWLMIERMPAKRFQVVCLRWLADWEVKEIAAHLEIKPSTVRAHVKDARDALRQ